MTAKEPQVEDETFDIVTTRIGTLKPGGGLVPEGTRAEVPKAAFSVNWMKPANVAAGKKIAAFLKAKEASEQGS